MPGLHRSMPHRRSLLQRSNRFTRCRRIALHCMRLLHRYLPNRRVRFPFNHRKGILRIRQRLRNCLRSPAQSGIPFSMCKQHHQKGWPCPARLIQITGATSSNAPFQQYSATANAPCIARTTHGARSSMSAQDGAAPQQQAPFTPAGGNGATQTGANFQQVPQRGFHPSCSRCPIGADPSRKEEYGHYRCDCDHCRFARWDGRLRSMHRSTVSNARRCR